jgi:membrane protease YdiL (CAAX protease family)
MNLVLATILQFLPFVIILWFANIAEGRKEQGKPYQGWTVLTYVLLGILLLVGIFGGLLIQAAGALLQSDLLPDQSALPPGLTQEQLQGLPRMGFGLWLPSLLGVALLLPPVRRALARLIPTDPSSTVHTVALVYTTFILAQLLVTTGLGLENVASLVESTGGLAELDLITVLWTQDIIWLLMAIIGVGWLSRKTLGEALQRLGIVTPSLMQLVMGISVGILLALGVTGLLSLASSIGIAVGQDVEKLSELLVGPLTQSIWGVLTLGLAAAIGEESILRGALQPRFGLLLTSIVFTLLHAQYGFSLATGVILVVGLILGLVRKSQNTSTSMLVHALYNITLGLLAFLGR